MSPLWSDLALARAAWANVVEQGLVDDVQQPKPAREPKQRAGRRLLRPKLSSFAL